MNWKKLTSLTAGDVGLLFEATICVTLANGALRMLPYRSLEKLNRGPGNLTPPSGKVERIPARIAWAVQAMARRLPGRNACLVQALAAQAMLRRRGLQGEVRIGVAGRDPSGAIKAHAWVECNGAVVIGGIADLSSYSVLTTPRTS